MDILHEHIWNCLSVFVLIAAHHIVCINIRLQCVGK